MGRVSGAGVSERQFADSVCELLQDGPHGVRKHVKLGNRFGVWILALLALGVAVVGVVWAADDGGEGEIEVRVQTRVVDGDRVEVAVQHEDEDGWSSRQLPQRRYLSLDSEIGQWKSSSPVGVASGSGSSLYCLVTHERPGDEEFWGLVRFGARQWDEQHAEIRVDVHAGATAAEQSEQIAACVEAGAVAIGVTLPDPDGVRDAIGLATEAGVYVASFNSGLEQYSGVGSIRHISVNEQIAGEVAGERLNAAGVEGVAVCVVHEVANIGLEERCDGLDAAYDGEVRRINVGASGVGDREATAAAIGEALVGDVGAVVALNSRISVIALEQVKLSGEEIAVATFDQNNDVLDALIAGEMLFALDTSPFAQAWYTLSTMLNNQPAFYLLVNQVGVADPQQILGSFEIQLTPRLITGENASAWLLVNRFTAGGAGE